MDAAAAAGVDVGPVEQRVEPRSTVTLTLGPRGQVMPKVTIVTGEPDELLAEIVLTACAKLDKELHRHELELAGGLRRSLVQP